MQYEANRTHPEGDPTAQMPGGWRHSIGLIDRSFRA
jgi:hypothetical protein